MQWRCVTELVLLCDDNNLELGIARVCDGIADCDDETDEARCSKTNVN